jgi:upstream activation factor subunit UAF30
MSERKRSKRPARSSKRSTNKISKSVVTEIPDVVEVLEEAGAVSLAALAEEVVVPEPTEDVVATPRRRRGVDREQIEAQFDAFMELLTNELEATRSDKTRTLGIKTWRNLIKETKKLKNNSMRAMKKTTKRKNKNNLSGFMKPVNISKQMAKFTGWKPEELRSRVDVTKYICNYIKDNDLQNPSDRRQILADKKLAKLLNYDKDREEKPLTYYYLQKKIQPHFS